MNRTYASIFILLFLVVLLRLFPNYTVKIEKKVLILYNSMVLDPVLIKLDVLLHNFFFFFKLFC